MSAQKKSRPGAAASPVMLTRNAMLLAVLMLLAGLFVGWQGAVVVLNQEAAQAGKPGMHQQPQAQAQTQAPGQPAGMAAMGSPLMAQAKALEEKAAKNPNDPKAWAELGNTYFDAELPERAVMAYQKSLALSPNQPDVWTDMGVMLRASGKFQEALNAFRQTVSLEPKHQQARLNMGVVLLFDLKDQAEGLKAWKELLAIHPDARLPDGKPLADAVKELTGPSAK